MWWQPVFWILLIPLVIAEVIIFFKSRRFFWLIYALSIFTYIIAVCYTIDVFSLGRNAVILVLLASAVIMFLIGRQLGKKVKKQRSMSPGQRNVAFALAAIMLIIFVVSVAFGRAVDHTAPVASVKASDILQSAEKDPYKPYGAPQVQILTRTVENNFFMRVPVVHKTYRVCLATAEGNFELQQAYEPQQQYEELSAGQTKTYAITVQPYYMPADRQVKPTSVRVYEQGDYLPCEAITEQPLYTIPVV